MAVGSGLDIELYYDQIPVLDGAVEFANMGIVPAGTYRNRDHVGSGAWLDPELPSYAADLLYDPQTSGGLLIALPEDKAMTLLAAYEGFLTLPYALIGRMSLRTGDNEPRIKVLKTIPKE